MPNWHRAKHFIVAATILLMPFFALRTHAAINQQINYQGKLYNSSGQQVANDAYNFRFSLCTSESSCGSPVWSETCTGSAKIYVTSSLFSTMLGSQTALSGVDFNQTLYLQVEVGGTGGTPSWETLLPRKILGAVPAAFRAVTSSYADNSGQLQGSTWASPGAIGSGTASTGVFTNATSTGILRVVGNSFLGAVASGTWQGTAISSTYGGTGIDSSAWTGIVKVIGGVWGTSTVSLASDVSGILAISNGGTGTSTAPTVGQLLMGNSSGSYDLVSTSSLGISGSASAAGSDGQIQFNDGGAFGASSNLFWNNTNNRLSINSSSPSIVAGLFVTTTEAIGGYFSNGISTVSLADRTSGAYSIRASNAIYTASNFYAASGQGLHSYSANGQLVIGFGGTVEIMRFVGTTQLVGIGTSTPNARLTVVATSTAPIVNFAASTSQSVFYISNTGLIGINTTTPAYPITLASAVGFLGVDTSSTASTLFSSANVFVVEGTKASTGGELQIHGTTGAVNVGSALKLYRTTAGGAQIYNTGFSASGSGSATIATQEAGANLTLSTYNGATDGDIVIDPADTGNLYLQNSAGTGNTYLMTGGSTGYVSVGTTTPEGTAKMYIYGSNQDPTGAGANGHLYLVSNSSLAADNGAMLGFGGLYTSSANTKYALIKGAKENASSGDYAGYLAFYTRANGSSPAEAMRLTSAGRMGLGTSTPASIIDIWNQTVSTTAVGGVTFNGDTNLYRLAANYLRTDDSFQALQYVLTSGASAISSINIHTASTGDTASTPGFSFGGDADTGMYNFSANNLGWSTSGTFKMILTDDGKLGVGTTTPASLLTVGSGGQFQVDTSGNLVAINNVSYSWPSAHGASGTLFTTDASGNLSWISTSSLGMGGGSESDPIWMSASGTLTVNHFALQNVSQWTNDAGYITSSASTSPAGLNGQIQFNNSGSFGASTTFVWDNVNGRVGVGTAAPEFALTLGGDGGIIARGLGEPIFDPQGSTLSTSGTGTRMIWYPRKASFRAGQIVDLSGLGFPAVTNQWDEANIGIDSFAVGINSMASGPASAAFGMQSTASGTAAVAVGTLNIASGANSFAGGNSASSTGDNSFAFGNMAGANGANSVAMGDRVIANGASSVAFGTNNRVTDKNSMAIGENSDVTNYYSFGGGLNADVAAAYSFAYGRDLTVNSSGGYNAVFGNANSVEGLAALVAGELNYSAGDYSATFGLYNSSSATADYSAVFGQYNTITGDGAFVAGSGNQVFGTLSAVFGESNIVTGSFSFVAGKGNSIGNGTEGSYSAALGYGNIVNNNQSVALGRENIIDTGTTNDSLVAIGRANIISGSASNGAIAMGYNSVASNASSIAIGTSATSSGNNAVAIGYGITVSGAQSFGVNVSTTNNPTISQANTIALMGGNVGIGDASPASLLTVGSGDLFQVDSAGNIIKIRNVTYSWPSSQGAASTILQNNGSGGLSWVTAASLGLTASGTAGGDLSGTYPNPQIATGTINPMDLNTSSAPTAQALLGYNSNSQFTWIASTTFSLSSHGHTSMVTGTGANNQVAFFNGATSVTGSPNLIWDNTNGYFGIGSSTPSVRLTVAGAAGNNAIANFTSSTNISALYIAANSNVGISSTSPSARLAVTGLAGNNNIVNFASSSNVSAFLINALGNVGINSSTPSARLGVVGLAGNNPIINFASSSGASAFFIGANGFVGINNANPSYRLSVAGDFAVTGTIRVGNAMASGTYGQVLWSTGTSTQWVPTSSLGIASSAAAAGSSGQVQFNSSNVLSASANFFWDISNNRLGLGTSVPSTTLHVSGTSTLQNVIPAGPYGGNMSSYSLGSSDARWASLWAGVVNLGTSTWSLSASTTDGRLGIFDQANGAGSERMTIATNGYVGIGTNNPSSPFHAVSTVAATTTANFQVTATNNNAGSNNARGNVMTTWFNANTGNNTGYEDGLIFETYANNGGAYTHSNVRAMVGAAYNAGSGTMTNLTGMTFGGGALGTGNITNLTGVSVIAYGTGSGVITNSVGLEVKNLNAYNDPVNTYGIRMLSNTAASGTSKYGLYIGDISNASTNNYSVYTNAGTVYFGDNVGIGTSTPGSLLTVASNGGFQVNSTGDLVKINNVDYAWPSANGASGTLFTTDAGGHLSWVSTSSLGITVSGIAGGDLTGTYPNPSLAIGVVTPMKTATDTAPSAQALLAYASDSAYTWLASTTFSLSSHAHANMVTGTATAGQVAFWNGANSITGSTTLYWDNVNGRLGVGTTTPLSSALSLPSSTLAAGGISFGSDVGLYRSGANILSLATGDTLNVVSGALTIANVQVISSGRLIQSATGTVAAPGISFQADTDTGLFTPVANSLGFTIGGSEKMRIDTNGNIGIGTTTAAYRLTVAGDLAVTGTIRVGNAMASGTYGQLLMSTGTSSTWVSTSSLNILASDIGGFTAGSVIFANTSGKLNQDNSNFYWDDTNNRLGIGTTSPIAALQVNFAAENFTAFDAYYTGSGSRAKIYNETWGGTLSLYDGGNNENIKFASAGGYSSWINNGGFFGIGTTTAVSGEKVNINGTLRVGTFQDWGGGSTITGMQPSGTETSLSLWQAGVASARIGSKANDSNLYITNDIWNSGLGTASTSITIASTGNIGIGDTSPGAKLAIFATGTSLYDISIKNQTDAIGNTAGIGFASQNAGGLLAKGAIYHVRTGGYDVGDLVFAVDGASDWNNVSTADERMRITSGGLVGIGTTAPGAILDVGGTSATGTIRLGTNTGSSIFELKNNNNNTFSVNALGTGGITLTNTGNVGIGTTSPASTLQSHGTLSITAGSAPAAGLNGLHSYFSGNVAYIIATQSGVANRDLHIAGDNLIFKPGGVEQLRITTIGNVGIGTSTPGSKLTVAGNFAVTGTIRVGNSLDAGTAGYVLQSNGAGAAPTWVASAASAGGWTDDGTVVRLTTISDNVGIGTTTPLFKLTVDGGIYASGTYGAGETLTYGGAGTRMMWYPRKAAFRAGRVSGTQWDDINIGAYSFASGLNTVATGTGSVAMGREAYVTEGYGVAIGQSVTSSGPGSFALGRNIIVAAKNSFGVSVSDNTEYQVTQGNTIAFVGGNVGIGTTSPQFTLTVDGGIYASGTYGAGETLTYGGDGTRMIWYPKKAAFRAGSAYGNRWDDENIGDYSASFGRRTLASGLSSFAVGYEAFASGSYSFAAGYSVYAKATSSVAMGQKMEVTGDNSFGIGLDGTGYTLSQANTMAIMGGNVGIGTTTPQFALTIQGGVYSTGTYGAGETLTYSGAGTRMMWYPRKAAFRAGYVNGTQWDDANIGDYSVSFGSRNKASGMSSFAVGSDNYASGTYSFVAGYGSIASATSSIALGEKISVTGGNSFGIGLDGSGATISQANTMAIMGGKIGIGKVNPAYTLDIVGNINIPVSTSTEGVIFMAGEPYLHSSGLKTNVFVGMSAGNLTVTGGYNTSIGNESLHDISSGTYNVAVGTFALTDNTTGVSNLALGSYAMEKNITGSYNTAVGQKALEMSTSSDQNTAIGYASLFSNTAGTFNTALGYGSLYSNLTGNYNTALGVAALYYSTSSDSNTAVGQVALGYNTSGTENTALGRAALRDNSSGYENTALGKSALTSNTTGHSNVAVGAYALYNAASNMTVAVGNNALRLNTVDGNVAVGYQAARSNQYASGIVAIGYNALYESDGNWNTAIGYNAMASTTNGSDNVAVGSNALDANTTGIYNTAVGRGSLTNNLSGSANVGLGVYALALNYDGGGNVAIGDSALYHNVSGYNNVGIGSYALHASTGTTGNTAVGFYALTANTVGDMNSSFGFQSLLVNTTGGSNSAFGSNALDSNISGSSNSAFGTGALSSITDDSGNSAFGAGALSVNTASSNTAFGFLALNANTLGQKNTAVGVGALMKNIGVIGNNGNWNTAIGDYAGSNNTSGYGNVFAGNDAGITLTTGYYNVIAGMNADVYSNGIASGVAIGYSAEIGGTGSIAIGRDSKASTTYSVAIGYGAQTWAGNSVALGNDAIARSAQSVAIGYQAIASTTGSIYLGTATNGKIYAPGIGTASTGWATLCYNSSTKQIAYNNATGACLNSSDSRLKVNIEEMSSRIDVLKSLLKLRGIYFNWDPENPVVSGLGDRKQIGVIAQEVMEVLPELVDQNPNDGYYSVDYPKLTAFLIEVAKLQQAMLDSIFTAITVNNDSSSIAYHVNTLAFSTTTYFTNSVSSTSGASAFILNALNFSTSTSDNYLLSLRSNNSPAFSVSANGDVHALGNMYAASAVLGTSTNPGDLAERVDINPGETVEAGDVMMVDPTTPDRYQKVNSSYEPTVAGVISTNPTIIVGNGKTLQTAPLAMVGRVPVKYSNENGSIIRGDLLVAAGTEAGKAMRYDPKNDNSRKVVGIVGIALENSADTTDGKVMTLIRTGWVYNKTEAAAKLEAQVQTIANETGVDISAITADSDLSVGGTSGGTITYSGTGSLDLANNAILNVKSITGTNNKWAIDENGLLTSKITTSQGDKNIYGMTSESAEITLSGTGTLQMGEAIITFATGTQEIIDGEAVIKVSVTLTSVEALGVAVIEKSAQGFKVKELGGGTSSSTFDWMVIAKRKISNDSVNIENPVTNPESSGGEGGVTAPLSPSGDPATTTEPVVETPSDTTPPTDNTVTESEPPVEPPSETTPPADTTPATPEVPVETPADTTPPAETPPTP